ncbi:MAG TPA: hypothetical protein VM901_11265 [Bdellovibrionota bacterium]|jgi:hypothetical protein|nr:hypothetical protein [Bdellovibrionota bacterium]
MYRISVMLHEARHSDGNYFVDGGFVHGICPEGHPFAGKDCDVMSNGPYSVAADILAQFHKACGLNKISCTGAEMRVLEGLALASNARVLDEDIYPKDAKGRKVVSWVNPEPIKIPGLPEMSLAKKK